MLGRARPELEAELSSFVVARSILFYRANDEGVVLIRVLHGARDLNDVEFG
jgi:toxin ParE1/3/4